jgi:hypothetical protein
MSTILCANWYEIVDDVVIKTSKMTSMIFMRHFVLDTTNIVICAEMFTI